MLSTHFHCHCLFLAAILALLCQSGAQSSFDGIDNCVFTPNYLLTPCDDWDGNPYLYDYSLKVVGETAFYSCRQGERRFKRCDYSEQTGAKSHSCNEVSSPCDSSIGDNYGFEVVGDVSYFSCGTGGLYQCGSTDQVDLISRNTFDQDDCALMYSPCDVGAYQFDMGFDVVGKDAFFTCSADLLFRCLYDPITGAVEGSCTAQHSPCDFAQSFEVIGEDAFITCGNKETRKTYHCDFDPIAGIVVSDSCATLSPPCNKAEHTFDVVGNKALFACQLPQRTDACINEKGRLTDECRPPSTFYSCQFTPSAPTPAPTPSPTPSDTFERRFSPEEVQTWLNLISVDGKAIASYNGEDLFWCEKDELKVLLGTVAGIKVYNRVHQKGNTILDVVNANVLTFHRIVSSSEDFTKAFGDQILTVFAPTNGAFDKVDQATLNDLLDPNKLDDLIRVLAYHVWNDVADADDLKTMDGLEVKTVSDDDLKVKVSITDNGVFINTAKVTTTDLFASNGVVHLIDAVLIPPGSPLRMNPDSPAISTTTASSCTTTVSAAILGFVGAFAVLLA